MHTVLLLKTSGIAGSLSWVSYLRATTQHPRNNQDCEPGYTVVHYTGLKEKMRCPFLCHLQRCYKSEQCSIYVNYIIFSVIMRFMWEIKKQRRNKKEHPVYTHSTSQSALTTKALHLKTAQLRKQCSWSHSWKASFFPDYLLLSNFQMHFFLPVILCLTTNH